MAYGVVLGTPEYLSPEQAIGARVDACSNLYCSGVVAYRVLLRRLPFDGPDPRKYIAQQRGAAAAGSSRPLAGPAPLPGGACDAAAGEGSREPVPESACAGGGVGRSSLGSPPYSHTAWYPGHQRERPGLSRGR